MLHPRRFQICPRAQPTTSARRHGVTTERAVISPARAERLPRLTLNAAAPGSSQATETAMGFPSTQSADIPEGQPFAIGHLNAELMATLPLCTGGRTIEHASSNNPPTIRNSTIGVTNYYIVISYAHDKHDCPMSELAIMHILRRDEESLVRDGTSTF